MSTQCSVLIAVIASVALSQLSLSSLAAGGTPEDQLRRVTLPNGKYIRVLTERPSKRPIRAVLILLPGGDGRLKLKPNGRIGRLRNNFLVRSRSNFHDAGYATALVDAPSDRQKKPGLLAGYRSSKIHAVRDIGTVLEALNATFGVPVFIVGTSRGSVSAANAARRAGQEFAGVALTASITVPNRKGATLRSVMLSKISAPTLFVHHASDKCAVTPLHGARSSFEIMQNAGAQARWTTVTGGRTSFAPCKGKSHHGFWGSERQAVGHIKNWIEQVLSAS